VTANSQCAASNLHGKDFVALHVVVDRAPIYIDNPSCAHDSYELHVLTAARAPYLFTEDARRLRLRSVHDLVHGATLIRGVTPPYSES
jgi:hypothetical protein